MFANMSSTTTDRQNSLPRIFYPAGIAVLILTGFLVLFFASLSVFKAVELERAEGRARLYHSTLVSALERLEHLPFILAQDPAVIRALDTGNLTGLNRRLEDFAQRSKAEAIYVMDATGLTVAASNYQQDVNFIGKNYGFRPYFKDAMEGKRGEFFAIGATTFTPGFFIGDTVKNSKGEVIGVAALKIALSELTGAWAASGDDILVTNADGVVVFATQDDWRYRTLEELNNAQRGEIAIQQQFGRQDLKQLDWQPIGSDEVLLNGSSYLFANLSVERRGWTLWYIASTAGLLARAWFVIILAAIVLAGLGIVFVTFRSNQLRRALRASHQDRQKLIVEIEERKITEHRLEKTQSELARTSKLAALGQLAASVTHELGQPISAMRNYLAADQISNGLIAGGLTEHLTGLVRRMENITKELKFFSLPGDTRTEEISLSDLIDGAIGLTKHNLDQSNIKHVIELDDGLPTVKCNRQRLEQVLVNLIRNAVTAMEDTEERTLTISASETNTKIVLSVQDTGHGLNGQKIDQLQEPFHTNKPSGEGMGLGLAISAAIVREHNGKLLAEDLGQGAVFHIQLPLNKD